MANLSITAALVVAGAGASVESGTSGEAISAGEVPYKAASGKYALADADSATPSARAPRGIALNSAALNQPLSLLRSGPIDFGADILTPGAAYYLSDDPGKICPLADVTGGDYIVQIGLATSARVLNVNILVTGVASS